MDAGAVEKLAELLKADDGLERDTVNGKLELEMGKDRKTMRKSGGNHGIHGKTMGKFWKMGKAREKVGKR